MADFTYDILVNILGDAEARAFANDAARLGYEIQKVKRMSRGMGGSLVEETQFAFKRLNQLQRDNIRLTANHHSNRPNVVNYQENYTDATPQGAARRLRIANALAKVDQRRIALQRKQIEQQARLDSQSNNNRVAAEFKLNDALRKQIDAEDKLVHVSQRQQTAIRGMIGESQHYHGLAMRFADMERDARVNGDHAAAQSHHLYFQRYISESRRMAAEAERAANQDIRAQQRVRNSRRSVISQLVHMKHAIWAVAALAGTGAIVNGFERVGHSIFEAYQASVQFNDEAVKAQTLFTSLGIGDTGKSQMQLEMGGEGVTANMKKQLEGAKLLGGELTQMLRESSARTGQDFSEIMGVVKAGLPDLKNKMGVSDNEFLAQGQNVKDFTKDLIELSAVMKMVDEKGRKMSFHAVGILEAFTGSGGDGKKGTGAANFLSLLRRENIKLKAADQKAITDAINARNPFKAMQEMKRALRGAGIDSNNIDTLLSKTREANVSGVTNAFKTMGAAITETSRTLEMKFFSSMRINMARIIADDKFKKMFKDWDATLGNFVDTVLSDLLRGMDWLAQNPEKVDKAFKTMISTFDGMYKILKEITILAFSFADGFLGTESGISPADSVDQIAKNLHTLAPSMKSLGSDAAHLAASLTMMANMKFFGLTTAIEVIADDLKFMKEVVEDVAFMLADPVGYARAHFGGGGDGAGADSGWAGPGGPVRGGQTNAQVGKATKAMLDQGFHFHGPVTIQTDGSGGDLKKKATKAAGKTEDWLPAGEINW